MISACIVILSQNHPFLCLNSTNTQSGDGNEDVSCNMTQANWDVAKEDMSGETISKEDAGVYYGGLRCHFVKYLFLPSIARKIKFVLKMNQVPPVINALASADLLYNSEHLKDSKIMQNRDKLFGNQELLMHHLKEGNVVLEKLDSYTNAELSELCEKLEFQNMSR